MISFLVLLLSDLSAVIYSNTSSAILVIGLPDGSPRTQLKVRLKLVYHISLLPLLIYTKAYCVRVPKKCASIQSYRRFSQTSSMALFSWPTISELPYLCIR